MPQQLIISIGREYGSGGHEIAEELAERFGLHFYDKNLLKEIATEKNVDVNRLEKYDELPRSVSRKVRGFSNSPEENIANMQFEYLRKMAENGKSFVIVGRCSETVLRDYSCMISIFILADLSYKIDRISSQQGISREKAEILINRQNKKRKDYHNYYCLKKWGHSQNYDISINSSRLGIERTANILAGYIQERMSISIPR
ncbi:MAG: cytidylate kinase-like family protein [Lachnospiraceae bacterium]|jgi:cytidylate kinase|nr:cytidylate kinase-like family protein [Lachnospiraceae bacterium]MCI9358906.1 cytidylate kinase-like family protein [Lachnospiraceae bacterium]